MKALPDTEQAALYIVSEPPTRAKAASRPQVKEPKAAVDLVPDTVVIESEAARAAASFLALLPVPTFGT